MIAQKAAGTGSGGSGGSGRLVGGGVLLLALATAIGAVALKRRRDGAAPEATLTP
ncbi:MULTISPECIES: hypothetical protein [unclassified Knoellia]|uniref:hypothetical protein n=1 Tax=Knoellia altitudinis TaxID=3404795 RepID=UPI0036246290